MATGRPLTTSNAPLATFAGRAHRCTAGLISRAAGLGVRPIGLTLGRCRSWPLSSCSQGGCCSLAARASSVARQQAARRWRISRGRHQASASSARARAVLATADEDRKAAKVINSLK